MKKPVNTAVTINSDYQRFVEELKSRIASARIAVARRVNGELILLYWDIGRSIVEKQKALGWGESVVDMLALELRQTFPTMTGFSPRNLRDMKRLYLAYSDDAIWRQAVAKMTQAGMGLPIWPQAVAKLEEGKPSEFPMSLIVEIPWGHHRLILDKLVDPAARIWYLSATARFGWSRNVLLHQIKAKAYERSVTEKKTHNFDLVMPEQFAEQADEMLKSSYCLDFLGLRRAVKERELEDRLVSRLQAFLLELGYGFCFIGRQHRITLGSKEYYIDLLFYHRYLKALVAFELKVGPIEPDYAGKMDFYLNLLNDKERGPDDQPSIGVILCAEKDDIEIEYALRTKANPIGVAAYELGTNLPEGLKGKLPTSKQIADIIRVEMQG